MAGEPELALHGGGVDHAQRAHFEAGMLDGHGALGEAVAGPEAEERAAEPDGDEQRRVACVSAGWRHGGVLGV